jgi:predicted outer membrane repeat protein
MEDQSMASTSIRARNLAAAISMALAAAGLHAATITVDSADDDPASMACNLRGALKAVNNGSTLAVPACSAAVSGDSFGINDTIVLAGLSPITLTQGALTVTASSVTIDGSGTMPSGGAPTAADFYQPYQAIDAAGGSRVLGVADGVTLSANSLMLTGGQTTGNGGGVSIGTGATVTLNNCSISSNTTTADGGAIYAAPSSTLKLVDSIISGNVSFAGGALFANDSTVTVTNTSIAYNEANYGGGVYSLSGALNLEKASIYKNTARTYSGGVFVSNGALKMTNSIVFANIGGRGGGMLLSGATGTIAASSVSGNTTTCVFACAGAILLDNSTLAVTGSTVSGNLATGHALYVTGGINLFGSTATFANSTISGNIAVGNDGTSGAFSQEHWGANTSLTLINSTVSDNTAVAFYGAAVGGVVLGTSHFSPPFPGSDTFAAQNTIVSGNAPAGSDIVSGGFGSSQTAEYSLLGSAQNISAFNDPANHNIFSDSPGLGPLDDNGGPTRTHALLPGSPALSAGSTALAMFSGQPLDFDQRGPDFLRIFGGAVDIGAFEDQTDQLFANGFESEP